MKNLAYLATIQIIVFCLLAVGLLLITKIDLMTCTYQIRAKTEFEYYGINDTLGVYEMKSMYEYNDEKYSTKTIAFSELPYTIGYIDKDNPKHVVFPDINYMTVKIFFALAGISVIEFLVTK